MFIKINSVDINKNRIDVNFTTDIGSENAGGGYFKEDIPFFCEYSEDIGNTPQSIAVIPFIVQVLPIIWLFDATLIVYELDKHFYDCMEKIKEGYIKMYPEAKFLGNINVKKIIDNDYVPIDKTTVFFSGGLDAFHTLTRHLEEKPDLITIWGSDLHITDIEGWENVKATVQKVGKEYGLKNVFIKSSFADFLEERKLSSKFWDVVHGFWYHNIQHGIGMLGLIAPYVYQYKVKVHYIASSYDDKKIKIECASDPSIDNNLKIASCKIIHDAFGFTRQDKISDIIQYRRNHNKAMSLRVCWAVKDGNNCCRCEKCYRTICGIIVECEDPIAYNFPLTKEILKEMKEFLTMRCEYNQVVKSFWLDIQQRFIQNRHGIKKQKKYYKYVSWLEGFNFDDLESNNIYKTYKRKIKIKAVLCRVMPKWLKNMLKKVFRLKKS